LEQLSGNKASVIVQPKLFPKEQFGLFSDIIKICHLRFIAGGIFYTYSHSIVPARLGYWSNMQLIISTNITPLTTPNRMFIIVLIGINKA
jgi:hypothetical protein